MAIIFPPGGDGDTFEAPNGIIYEFSDGAWRLSAENQGSVGVHMSTTPPDSPQNGDLWFHTGEADLKIFYIDPSSSQWIPASSPPDPYEENFVSVSGDTMTGTLTMQKMVLDLTKQMELVILQFLQMLAIILLIFFLITAMELKTVLVKKVVSVFELLLKMELTTTKLRSSLNGTRTMLAVRLIM